MKGWLYKTDDSGRPRRFLSRREVIPWAALKTGRCAGPAPAIGLVTAIFDPQGLGREVFLSLAVMVFAACALAVAGIYVHVALSGGVMGSEERGRYLGSAARPAGGAGKGVRLPASTLR